MYAGYIHRGRPDQMRNSSKVHQVIQLPHIEEQYKGVKGSQAADQVESAVWQRTDIVLPVGEGLLVAESG